MGEIFERKRPETPLAWTGERLTTDTSGQVEIEHLHRYFYARSLCIGLDVLDVASGEGYGSALLAQLARSVVGVEVSEDAVEHANRYYAGPNLEFRVGDARTLPIPDSCVDMVVSFETIEHFTEHDAFLSEVARVLRPHGRLIISSPDRDIYSPSGSSANAFHKRELSRAEFVDVLGRTFRHVRCLSQRTLIGSALIADSPPSSISNIIYEKRGTYHFEACESLPRAPYIIAACSNTDLDLLPNSIYIDSSEVGMTLSKAAQYEEVAGCRKEIELLRDARDCAREELGKSIEQANLQADNFRQQLARASNTIERLQLELNQAESQRSQYKQQLDVLTREFADKQFKVDELTTDLNEQAEARTELHRELAKLQTSHMLITQHRDALRSRIRRSTISKRTPHIAMQVQDASTRASEWEAKYNVLRERLELILTRFRSKQIARLFSKKMRVAVRQALRDSDGTSI
ncbi:methyltransferase domain-containing protein [Hyphomicrobium sp. B1]|uniref:methyltransferase domain-containing protein n=1 Tax=Hyphomicrobium sp. B1 TaxID=3075651 RepID=UPI003C2E8366